MKTTGLCEQCGKVVKVKKIHFAGFNATVYLKCGHDVHYVYAYKSKADHADLLLLGQKEFEGVQFPLATHFP